MKTLLYLWDSEYPWDIRVNKSCSVLMEHGWDVHLVCRNKFNKLRYEEYVKLKIHRIYCPSKSLDFINELLTFPFFLNPIWLFEIMKVAKLHKVDVILVRDLPMAIAAIIVGKVVGIPVILDMAECYPEMLRLIWKYEPLNIPNLLLRNPYFAYAIEKVVIKSVEHIFVMVEESRERIIRKGADADIVSIVSNTPVISRFAKPEEEYPGSMEKHRGEILLLYVGLLNFSRGLEVIFPAIRKLLDMNVDVHLVILGTGKASRYYQDKVKVLGLEKNVSFEGWIDNSLVPKYIASADVCLIPHRKCSHWDNTVPNKLFDYMAAGKPVLSSNTVPVKRIIDEAKCGLSYVDNDIDDIVRCLVRLTDKQLQQVLGENGRAAVASKYNWDNDSKVFLETIGKIMDDGKS